MKIPEFGLYTFADTDPAAKNQAQSHNQRIKNLLEEIRLADELELDVFGVGEHHRADYAVSSPSTILAAAAVQTKAIRLTSAVTVLSSDDPVRVFQQFATVDQLSGGRAEIMAGRGSFTESFPLFGYPLELYDELFEEKLKLLVELNKGEILNWDGKLRASVKNRGVYPRPLQDKIPIWVAVGGTPASLSRAASLNLPVAIAIIGGNPERFVPFADHYRKSLPAETTGKISINSIGYIAGKSEQAAEEFYPAYAAMMDRIGKERGWQPMSRQAFEAMRRPEGSLLAGSPEEIIEKLLFQHKLFNFDRFLIQMSVGTMDHAHILNSIRLFAEEVVPEVKKRIKSNYS